MPERARVTRGALVAERSPRPLPDRSVVDRPRVAAPRRAAAAWRTRIEKFARTPKGYVLGALVLLLAVALPGQGQPAVWATLASVLTATILEMLLRRTFVPSTSALLSGLFVGMVLDPHNSLAVVVATSGAAIGAKHLLRTSRAHIFNPAVGALALAPSLLGAGESWWGAAAGLPAAALVLLLLAGYLVADRVHKLPSVLIFLGVYFALFTAAAVLIPGENTHLAQFYRDPFVGAVLFFAFFMLTDPPTSPIRLREQLIFGAGVAALAVAVEVTHDTLAYMFIGLLIGNAWWAWRRVSTSRMLPVRAEAPSARPASVAPSGAGVVPIAPVATTSRRSSPASTSGDPARFSRRTLIAVPPGVGMGSGSGKLLPSVQLAARRALLSARAPTCYRRESGTAKRTGVKMKENSQPFLVHVIPWLRPATDRGPTEGNHRLTALTGSLLAPLLALIFLTGLLMDAWWHIHYIVGFVLIPVVALKLASTGYRALRYYTHDPIYVAAGPPELFPRLLAPFLAVSVVLALATGVVLYAQHSRSGVFSTLHTDSAVCSVALVGLHFLTYVTDALAAILRDLRTRLSRAASLRLAVVVAAMLIGIILAAVTYSAGVWPQRPHGYRDGRGLRSIVVNVAV